MTAFDWLSLIMGYVATAVVGGFGFVLLAKVWKGGTEGIDLNSILNEPDGSGASLSRFQFLIFTMVIAICLLYITLKNGAFPGISGNVFALLGISGGSYVLSKGIHLANPPKKQAGDNPPAPPKPPEQPPKP